MVSRDAMWIETDELKELPDGVDKRMRMGKISYTYRQDRRVEHRD